MEDLIELAWKATVASGVLMLVVASGQCAGPLLASIAMTYPFNSGVGFSLMMWQRSDAFMAEAGVAAFALTGGVFAFMTGYVLAASLGGFLRPWLTGIGAWAPPVPAGRGVGTWRATIARAVLGGVIIGAVATFSKLLGPVVSGMLLAFPTMMSASLWILHRRFGEAFAVETIHRSRWGLASYSSFVFSVGLLSLPIGGIAAVATGAAVAVLVSLAVYRIGRPRG